MRLLLVWLRSLPGRGAACLPGCSPATTDALTLHKHQAAVYATMYDFATDEDLALRASADLPLLCPREQTISSGSDGASGPDGVAGAALAAGADAFLIKGSSPERLLSAIGVDIADAQR